MPGTANSGGRNKKSAQQHRLQGTYQKVRHEGSKAPTPPRGVPKVPKALKGDALAEWNRMVGRLQTSGALSVVDDAALFQYAQLFAETEAIAEAREQTESLIEGIEDRLADLDSDAVGDAIDNLVKLKQLESRYMTQVRQGRMALRAYLVEFGMTPAARSRVKLPDAKSDVDPLDEFFNDPPATH
jgi:P27 family predicted phage terminase small subunit